MGEEPEASGVSDGGLTGSGGAHGLRSALDRQTALSPSGSVFEPRTPTVSPSGSGSGSVWGDDPLGLAKPAQVRATSETRPRSSSTGSSVWGDDPLGLSKTPVTQRKSASGSSSVWGDDPLGLSKSSVTKPAPEKPDTQEKSSSSDGSPWAADPLSPRGSVFKLAPSAEEPQLEPASLNL